MKYEIDEISEIEDLGEATQEVYDIGMIDTPHTFFANDILVHNSLYCNVGNILKSFNYPHINDNEKCLEFLEAKIEPLIFKVINNIVSKLMIQRHNCKECKISFKREMIARRACFLAKKRYMAWVLKMETERVKEGSAHEIEVKGLEMVRSSTPEMIRNILKKFNLALLKDVDYKKANDFIREVYDLFRSTNLEQIARITNVNNLEKYTGDDGAPVLGTPGHVKATIGYNMMLEKYKLEDTYEKIYEGDKIKTVYIKTSYDYPYSQIAFKEKLPTEFKLKELIDYDTMWEKVFIKPIRPLYETMKWSLPNFDQVDISDLFY
jgi:DNA polymerase elongation subunit (family B)